MYMLLTLHIIYAAQYPAFRILFFFTPAIPDHPAKAL